MTEELVAAIDDDYEHSVLPHRQRLAVRFADRFLRMQPVTESDATELRAEFSEDEIEDLRLSMALFHGVSKVLIALGCEPEQMDTTVLATPGSGAR